MLDECILFTAGLLPIIDANTQVAKNQWEHKRKAESWQQFGYEKQIFLQRRKGKLRIIRTLMQMRVRAVSEAHVGIGHADRCSEQGALSCSSSESDAGYLTCKRQGASLPPLFSECPRPLGPKEEVRKFNKMPGGATGYKHGHCFLKGDLVSFKDCRYSQL